MVNVGNSNIIFIYLSIDDEISDDSSRIEVINPKNLKVLYLKVRHPILKFVDVMELVDARDLSRNVVEAMKPAELKNLQMSIVNVREPTTTRIDISEVACSFDFLELCMSNQ